jgi:hypothetical protein
VNRYLRCVPIVFVTGVVAACGAGQDRGPTAGSPALAEATQSITADGLLNHISILASDEFEGRAPGSIARSSASMLPLTDAMDMPI